MGQDDAICFTEKVWVCVCAGVAGVEHKNATQRWLAEEFYLLSSHPGRLAYWI